MIRLLKKLNGIPYGGLISEPTGEDTNYEYTCTDCGTPVEEDAKICPNCGANLEEVEEQKEEV